MCSLGGEYIIEGQGGTWEVGSIRNGVQFVEMYNDKFECTFEGPATALNGGDDELTVAETELLKSIAGRVDTLTQSICGYVRLCYA